MDQTAQHLAALWHSAQSAANDASLELNVQPSTTSAGVVHVMAPPAKPPGAALRTKPVRAPVAPVARPAPPALSAAAMLVLIAIAVIILVMLWGCGARPTAAHIPESAYALSRRGAYGGGVFNFAMAVRRIAAPCPCDISTCRAATA